MHGCRHQYVAAGSMVRKLLILESERGPLSGFQPAVSEVVEYLNSVSLPKVRNNFLIVSLIPENLTKGRAIYIKHLFDFVYSMIHLSAGKGR